MTKLERMLAKEGLYIGGHRGWSTKYPENTLLAVKEACELGVDLIEVDVYLTKDNIPVVCHDKKLERCSTGTGLVHEHTLEELKQLDFGIHRGPQFEGIKLPTLKQFYEMMLDYPEVLLNIDCKVYERTLETAEAAIAMAMDMGIYDRCVFNSIDCDVVIAMTNKYGRRWVGAPHDYPWRRNFSEEFMKKVWGICIPYEMLDWEHVNYYRECDIAIVMTPCDTPEQVEYTMQFSPTMPMPDDPRAYIKLAQEKGIWTPWKKD